MSPAPPGRARAGAILGALAAAGWAWAVALLWTREHWTTTYTASATAPPLWGFWVLDNAALLAVAAAGAAVGTLCCLAARNGHSAFPPSTRWLLASWLVPLADLARLAGWQVPLTFFEPIFIAALTGGAARQFVRDAGRIFTSRAGSLESSQENPARGAAARGAASAWLAAVCVLAIACAGWWYYDSHRAYDDYLLGYNDFGHFAWRVANTWEGRGFLLETPGLPAFWDHFNPGLALLAPLWGLWPDAGLFLAIQAICLALPAPLVYCIARRLGGGPGAATAWAAAYLLYPAVGQLNLNATYGWHPVSLALPLVFAALAALLSGRRVAAVAACVLACSFQEDVLIVLACLCLTMSLQAWLDARRRVGPRPDAVALCDRLPWWGWLAACLVLLATFAAIFEFTAFSRYQVGRFSRLGGSFGEVLLSPLLRPRVFWGIVLRPTNAYYLLALWVPLATFQPRELRRGWTILAATFLPLAVLVAWGHWPATSIAFQYATVLIPLFFAAAMVGATAPAEAPSDRAQAAAPQPRANSLAASGVAALAACAVASLCFGAMPWSGPTLTDLVQATYPNADTTSRSTDRETGSEGNRLLKRIVEQVGGREASVLATGRIASHLLRVRRLDTVAQAGDRWKQFEAEIGPGRSPIELFDYVVLDAAERFYQSPEQRQFILEQARQAGYRPIVEERGISVYARPVASLLPKPDSGANK